MELMETPRDCRWNIPIGILIHMNIDTDRLERAVQRLVDENDIFAYAHLYEGWESILKVS